MSRSQTLHAWKRRLGARASYRELAERTGVSTTTLQKVLKEWPSAIDINRKEVMDKVEKALRELEAEEDDENEPAYAA